MDKNKKEHHAFLLSLDVSTGRYFSLGNGASSDDSKKLRLLRMIFFYGWVEGKRILL
jgi:hypothetical protein